jgi:hypothetical protein
MSSVIISGDTSGAITLSAPAVSGTTTLTLPATTGSVIGSNSSGDIQFNSGYGSITTAYGCRAWVNFNADGTVTIRASGNVSSITDNSTGQFTMNFTTAMPNTNYCPVSGGGGTVRNNTLTNVAFPDSLRATGSVGIDTQYVHATAFDPAIVAVAIFR